MVKAVPWVGGPMWVKSTVGMISGKGRFSLEWKTVEVTLVMMGKMSSFECDETNVKEN